jgi:uncharacterized protein YndB with AHSA1/START domain/effector-binding domain-containing protein
MPVAALAPLKTTAPGDLEIVMTREFDAPRPLVFEAFTKPELVRRWLLGPPGWSMPVCEIDLRVGGTYRYGWQSDGSAKLPANCPPSFGSGGVFREVSAPARIVHTERMDGWPGESVVTTLFEEKGGRTAVTMTMLFESKEARDGALKSGMEGGVAMSYGRLDEILDAPQIVETSAQPVALLHVTVPRAEMMKVMGPGIQELMAAVAAQGVATTGPWFTHHLKMDPAVFDFEIGVPVAAPVSPAGRVKPGTWPAATMARTVYRGPYEGLGAAWGEFEKWIKAAGHTSAPDLWERYVKGPETGPDGATYRTELNRPLMG